MGTTVAIAEFAAFNDLRAAPFYPRGLLIMKIRLS
jgi:hypothetical protein